MTTKYVIRHWKYFSVCHTADAIRTRPTNQFETFLNVPESSWNTRISTMNNGMPVRMLREVPPVGPEIQRHRFAFLDQVVGVRHAQIVRHSGAPIAQAQAQPISRSRSSLIPK